MSNLEKEARIIARKNDFYIKKKIYQAYSICIKDYRNMIFSGNYKGKSAVLKVYNEERITDEPEALKFYNGINRNKIFSAPKLYKYKINSASKGWLIMEEIKGNLYKSPLDREERREFINLYLDYRRIFPKKSYKKLSLLENLKPNEYNIYRINKWLKLAAEKQAEDKLNILKNEEFLSRYRKAIKFINKEFKNRGMIFSHGHFKPKEIFKTGENRFYLTDFGHVKMYPEGYELGFIIWADYLIPANWKLDYKKWRVGIFNWIDELKMAARKLKIKNYDSLIRVNLVERSMGTILADVRASDKPKNEKIKRIKLLYQLIDELV